jgi:hypothetical protein
MVPGMLLFSWMVQYADYHPYTLTSNDYHHYIFSFVGTLSVVSIRHSFRYSVFLLYYSTKLRYFGAVLQQD